MLQAVALLPSQAPAGPPGYQCSKFLPFPPHRDAHHHMTSWQSVDDYARLTKKQLMERLRVFTGTPPAAGAAGTVPSQSFQRQPRDWSHRKAEWVCASCGTQNFVSKEICRRCRTRWSNTCALLPAGSPPVRNGRANIASAQVAQYSARLGTSDQSTFAGVAPPTGISPDDPPSLAQRIKVRRALLAAAKQQGESREVQEEVHRHESLLEVLLAEEKAALPPESRLRSLLDKVKHKETTLASEEAKVVELTAQLQAAKEAAEETRASLTTDKTELATLQAKMSAGTSTVAQEKASDLRKRWGSCLPQPRQ